MADVNAIFVEIVEGLVDNSRVNRVAYDEGWDPDLALQIYYEDDERIRSEQGEISEDERAKLLRWIGAWLAKNAGKAA